MDLSIRRKALDLMFLVCTEDSVKLITKEMLLYFKEDEPQLKEDIALKVAILSEKYAQDFKWYIESMIKMIELAGDYLSEDIVFRFIQIMTGFDKQEQSEVVQKYSVEKVVKLLEKEYINENGVRLGALVVGEFGYLYQGESKVLFNLIKKHKNSCSQKTILMIFNCFMKLCKQDSSLIELTVPFLEEYLESWNPELQQRAVEYYILCKHKDDNIENVKLVRDTVFDKMPVFSQEHLNNSILMKRLSKLDKNLYSKTKEGAIATENEKNEKFKNLGNNVDTNSGNSNSNVMSFIETDMDQLSNEVSNIKYDKENHPFANHVIFQKDMNSFAPHINKIYEYAEKIDNKLLENNFSEFRSFLTNNTNAGVILQNVNFAVEMKLKSLEKGLLAAMLTFNAIDSLQITDITVFNQVSDLEINISKVKQVNANTCQIMVKLKILNSFVQPPVLSISTNTGNYLFALPIVITKYIEVYDVPIEEYTTMWVEFGCKTGEETQRFDSIMYNPLDSSKSIMDFLKKLGGLLNSLGFKVYSPNDINNYHEIEAIGILPFGDNKLIPILIQASFLPSFKSEFRFSIRTKNKDYSLFSNLTLDIYSIVKFFINPK